MIENHQHFTYNGYVTHLDWVLFIFDEGIYAHRLAKPVTDKDPPGLGTTDDGPTQAVRAQLLRRPLPDWIEGWHPAEALATEPGDPLEYQTSWGNADAARLLPKFDVGDPTRIQCKSPLPLFIMRWSSECICTPYHPGEDKAFAWFVNTPLENPAQEWVVIPRPMLSPGQPGFNPAYNAAAAHALLDKGVPAKRFPRVEIAGAGTLVLKGYQFEQPDTPPNLFFDGGVLIQTHADPLLKGFHPWPDAFSPVIETEAADKLTVLLNQPETSRGTLLKLTTVNRPDVPEGFCKALVDRTDNGVRLTLLRGYVPLTLPDGKPNPAASPAIDQASATLALRQGTYAPEVDPRRVSHPPRFDAGSNWEIDEIAALAMALYCNGKMAPLPHAIGHQYLFPLVAEYLKNERLFGFDYQPLPAANLNAMLERYGDDHSLQGWLILRVGTNALMTWMGAKGLVVKRTLIDQPHTAAFKDGEFKNAIVIAEAPDFVGSAQGLNLSPADAAALANRTQQRTNPLMKPLKPGAASTLHRRTAMYFTPQGECMVPGSLALYRGSAVRYHAHPKLDQGWGKVEVFQL